MSDTKTEKQKVQEITEKLEQGLQELFESEKYKSYLSTMSKFHNYSFNNTLLIAMQKPDATLVAGFKAWQKNFERHVNKGEKGIRILAPAPYKIKEEREKIDPVTNEPMIDKVMEKLDKVSAGLHTGKEADKGARVSIKEKLSQMKVKSEQTKKEPDMAKNKSKEASL